MTLFSQDSNSDDFYGKVYKQFMGTGIVGFFWKYIHRKMEKPFDRGFYPRILEVGAGNGEHFTSVKCEFEEYVASDIRIDILARNLIQEKNIKIVSADAEELPFPDNYFDRVIITCVLPHINSPVKAIQELFRVTRTGGIISIYVPCEPGIFLRFARFFSTTRKANKLKIENIEFIHFSEHKNYYLAINNFIMTASQRIDSKIQSTYFPFRFLTWNSNLFKIYQITKC